jgi:hypothetical protein
MISSINTSSRDTAPFQMSNFLITEDLKQEEKGWLMLNEKSDCPKKVLARKMFI